MAGIIALPYRIRYASGRDTCVKCGTQIPKGQIQLAIIEQVMNYFIFHHVVKFDKKQAC